MVRRVPIVHPRELVYPRLLHAARWEFAAELTILSRGREPERLIMSKNLQQLTLFQDKIAMVALRSRNLDLYWSNPKVLECDASTRG